MLIIKGLHVSYQKGEDVLCGLELSLETGKVHGLVGLNGSGKTTFLNALYGFVRPSEGEVQFNGNLLRRKDIAYLEAENFFYPYMTGREYIRLFPGSDDFDMDNWQKLFSLPLDDITENYSTGMRKKLALLAVLKQDKPILILDEPFNGLDIESTHLLNLILEQLRSKGKTILITSHIFESLTNCCDYIHYLSDARIKASYTRPTFHQLQQEIQSTIEKDSASLLKQLFQ